MTKEEKVYLNSLVERQAYTELFTILKKRGLFQNTRALLNALELEFIHGGGAANFSARVFALIGRIEAEENSSSPSLPIFIRKSNPAMLWVGLILLLFLGYLASFHPVFNKPASDEKQVLIDISLYD